MLKFKLTLVTFTNLSRLTADGIITAPIVRFGDLRRWLRDGSPTTMTDTGSTRITAGHGFPIGHGETSPIITAPGITITMVGPGCQAIHGDLPGSPGSLQTV